MKTKKTLNKKKGQAGLNILLSIVSMLFMIGIIVMVFVLAGNKLASTVGDKTSGTIANETITLINGTAVATSVVDLTSLSSIADILVYNETSTELVTSGNYTESNGYFTATTTNTEYTTPTKVNVSFTYEYYAENTASKSIADSTLAIDDTTDWFSTFIVMASLVVLVLLVVIIINSIRRSGITGEGSSGPGA